MLCENCGNCSDSQCGMRSGSFRGMGFGPVVAAGIKLAPVLVSLVGKLFGAKPRGDLQKFQRNAYPYMLSLAQQTGLNVYIGWFGQQVVVRPDGQYGVAVDGQATNEPLAVTEQRIPALEGGKAWYHMECPSGVDCVNRPEQLTWSYHGGSEGGGLLDTLGGMFSGGDVLTPSGTVEAGAGPMSTWLGIGAVVLIGALILQPGRRTHGKSR
jgi:hypothetical protein